MSAISLRIDLLRLLDERNMTQKALAQLAGLSENTVSSIVNGQKKIYLGTLEKICEALEINVTDLIVQE